MVLGPSTARSLTATSTCSLLKEAEDTREEQEKLKKRYANLQDELATGKKISKDLKQQVHTFGHALPAFKYVLPACRHALRVHLHFLSAFRHTCICAVQFLMVFFDARACVCVCFCAGLWFSCHRLKGWLQPEAHGWAGYVCSPALLTPFLVVQVKDA